MGALSEVKKSVCTNGNERVKTKLMIQEREEGAVGHWPPAEEKGETHHRRKGLAFARSPGFSSMGRGGGRACEHRCSLQEDRRSGEDLWNLSETQGARSSAEPEDGEQIWNSHLWAGEWLNQGSIVQSLHFAGGYWSFISSETWWVSCPHCLYLCGNSLRRGSKWVWPQQHCGLANSDGEFYVSTGLGPRAQIIGQTLFWMLPRECF